MQHCRRYCHNTLQSRIQRGGVDERQSTGEHRPQHPIVGIVDRAHHCPGPCPERCRVGQIPHTRSAAPVPARSSRPRATDRPVSSSDNDGAASRANSAPTVPYPPTSGTGASASNSSSSIPWLI